MQSEQLQYAKSLFFIALSIDIAVTLIDLGGTFWTLSALKDLASGVRILDNSLQSRFEFWDNFGRFFILTTIGVGLTLINWQKSCYRFAKEALRATGLQQEWWIAGWIVPVFWFFKPYQVINEIYKVSSPNYSISEDWKKEKGSGLLLTWWIFWAVTHFIMWIISKEVFRNTFHEHLTFVQINGLLEMHLWLCFVSIAIAGLWFVVASHLTDRLITRSSSNTTSCQPNHSNSASSQTVSMSQTLTKLPIIGEFFKGFASGYKFDEAHDNTEVSEISRVLACPSCHVHLRFKFSGEMQCRCPQCKATFRVDSGNKIYDVGCSWNP